MKEQRTMQGRSLLFNIIFIVLNLTGLTFMTLGYHDNFEDQSTMFKLIGLMLMISTIGGVVVFRGRLLMSSVARILVGGLFIVSGLVKANDPIGFAYKLEEYFEDGALAYRIKEWFSMPDFSLEFFMDYALTLSVIICIAEIVLGVLTIIGGKIKLVSYLMLFMMLFFTFLTWHTSTCDASVKFIDRDTYAMNDPVAQMKINEAKDNDELTVISKSDDYVVVDEYKLPQCVDDCGCFGDAMKGSVGRSLSPKESLWKDLILVYLVIWIFAAQWIIKPNTRKQNIVFFATSMLVILFFSWVFSWYFPFFFGFVSILAALWILRVGGKYLGNYYGVALVVSLLCALMVYYVLSYLPLKDYRPYAVGSNLVEKMNDGIEGVYESMLVYKNKKSGETKEYSSTSKEYTESKIWEDKDWEYQSMVQKAIVPTKIPSITDQFNPFVHITDVSENELKIPVIQKMYDEASVQGVVLYDVANEYDTSIPLSEYNLDDYSAEYYIVKDTIQMMNPEVSDLSIRDYIIEADKIVLISAKSLIEANWSSIDRIKAIAESCESQNVPFAIICGADREQVNAFRSEHAFNVPIFVNDETELKAISRSNPTLLIIEKGIVKGKYPFRSIPTKDRFTKIHLK